MDDTPSLNTVYSCIIILIIAIEEFILFCIIKIYTNFYTGVDFNVHMSFTTMLTQIILLYLKLVKQISFSSQFYSLLVDISDYILSETFWDPLQMSGWRHLPICNCLIPFPSLVVWANGLSMMTMSLKSLYSLQRSFCILFCNIINHMPSQLDKLTHSVFSFYVGRFFFIMNRCNLT